MLKLSFLRIIVVYENLRKPQLQMVLDPLIDVRALILSDAAKSRGRGHTDFLFNEVNI
jgi:hypothetical protein